MEALAGRDPSQTAPQMPTAPGRASYSRGRRGRGASSRTGRAGTLRPGAAGDGRGAAGSGRSRWRDPSTAAARPAGRSGGVSRQRSPPRTTTPSHRRVEQGPDCRPASSQRGTSPYGMDLRLHPCSVAPAECHEKCGPNRPTPTGYSCNNARRLGRVLGTPIHRLSLRITSPWGTWRHGSGSAAIVVPACTQVSHDEITRCAASPLAGRRRPGRGAGRPHPPRCSMPRCFMVRASRKDWAKLRVAGIRASKDRSATVDARTRPQGPHTAAGTARKDEPYQGFLMKCCQSARQEIQ